ncbi:hypothetical protein CLOM_g9644 [Closterium sp. NIES-68]|nr:hypothetical protein CLOM_g6070 [Closterium sp. NIES-68]GJP50478.1 hypothetical protein CLOM_g9644 [Closterium sp. NIES-68]
MRKLQYHEQRLLRKVNFLQWKSENNVRELEVMRRYHITERDDYSKYNRLCGKITKLTTLLKKLDPTDPFRIEMTDQLINKLYNMGVIPTQKSLALCDKISVSSFCRRRLAVVMVRLKMAEHMREAVAFVQQGHVRIGPEAVKDPAFLVTRAMEDMLTWVDTSKIKQKVLQYNDKLDDYDLLN